MYLEERRRQHLSLRTQAQSWDEGIGLYSLVHTEHRCHFERVGNPQVPDDTI